MKMRLKKVLKLVSLFLVTALLLNVSFISTANAESTPGKEVLLSKTVVNEYESIKN